MIIPRHKECDFCGARMKTATSAKLKTARGTHNIVIGVCGS